MSQFDTENSNVSAATAAGTREHKCLWFKSANITVIQIKHELKWQNAPFYCFIG